MPCECDRNPSERPSQGQNLLKARLRDLPSLHTGGRLPEEAPEEISKRYLSCQE